MHYVLTRHDDSVRSGNRAKVNDPSGDKAPRRTRSVRRHRRCCSRGRESRVAMSQAEMRALFAEIVVS